MSPAPGPRGVSLLRGLLGAVALVLACACDVLAAPIPPWLAAVAAQEVPAYAAEVPGVILLREESLTIGPRASVTTHTRYAMRVLTRTGCKLAITRFDYLSGSESVRDPQAWLIRGGKEVKLPKSRPWMDIIADPEAAYNEQRVKVMDYSDVAAPGDVIACEGDVVGTLLFAQAYHAWDNTLPTLLEQFQVTVPKGWAITASTDGPMSPVEAASATDRATTRGWNVRDLPFRPDEPYLPRQGAFNARVFVTFGPGAAAAELPAPGFRSWTEAAAWWRKLASDQCDSSPALVAKTRQLLAECPDDLSRLRAIAGYVQNLRYVSVSRALGIGFGYRPRKASEVFSRGWGDCKDKTNLMRAMLHEAGFTTAVAMAHGSAGVDVNPAWPTFAQFNHAIIAIRVPPGSGIPGGVTTASLGELVFFDPTSTHTWFGDLPYPLRGSKVHVIGDDADELVTLPGVDPATSFRMERSMNAALGADGSITGSCWFVASGQSGAALRALVRGWSARELEANAGEFISDVLRGSKVTAIKMTDEESLDRSTLTLEFSTPKAVQPLPGRAMLVRLDLLSRRGLPAFPARTRTLPVDLPPYVVVDTIRLDLPLGFALEDLPPPAARQSPHGSYTMSVAGEGAAIIVERALRLSGGMIPVEDYAKLRQFLNDVVAVDKAAVVVRPAN